MVAFVPASDPGVCRIGLRLLQEFLQSFFAAEGGSPGARTNPHPVLANTVQIDQPFPLKDGDGMREYFLQEVQVFNEEIGEQVVVKGDATASQRKALWCVVRSSRRRALRTP